MSPGTERRTTAEAEALRELAAFPLVEALFGRSRRFAVGNEILDGPLQAQYVYDTFFKPGAYLRTHAEHMESWHNGTQER